MVSQFPDTLLTTMPFNLQEQWRYAKSFHSPLATSLSGCQMSKMRLHSSEACSTDSGLASKDSAKGRLGKDAAHL